MFQGQKISNDQELILERIVHSHVISHLNSHQMPNDAQQGFRKRRSCESQLVLRVQDPTKGLNDGEQIDAVLPDFSKTFDKVPNQSLLEKLRHHGVNDPAWKLLGTDCHPAPCTCRLYQRF